MDDFLTVVFALRWVLVAVAALTFLGLIYEHALEVRALRAENAHLRRVVGAWSAMGAADGGTGREQPRHL